jgi:hypothetical protein
MNHQHELFNRLTYVQHSQGQPLHQRKMISPNRRTPLAIVSAILLSCLVAGTLDIFTAFFMASLGKHSWHVVLQAIASGLLGAAAFRGEFYGFAGTEMLGLALHYGIMLGIVLVFWQLAPRLTWTSRLPAAAGALFGVVVYIVMNAVVLKLSAISYTPNYKLVPVAMDMFSHVFFVGIPIALILHRWAINPPTGNKSLAGNRIHTPA